MIGFRWIALDCVVNMMLGGIGSFGRSQVTTFGIQMSFDSSFRHRRMFKERLAIEAGEGRKVSCLDCTIQDEKSRTE